MLYMAQPERRKAMQQAAKRYGKFLCMRIEEGKYKEYEWMFNRKDAKPPADIPPADSADLLSFPRISHPAEFP